MCKFQINILAVAYNTFSYFQIFLQKLAKDGAVWKMQDNVSKYDKNFQVKFFPSACKCYIKRLDLHVLK